MQFLVGMGTMLLASIIGGFVGGYLISLFRVGPYPPWQPIDKNIGLESAICGIIAGNFLATAALAGASSRRGDRMPLWVGLAFFASEFLLAFSTRQGVGLGTLILTVRRTHEMTRWLWIKHRGASRAVETWWKVDGRWQLVEEQEL